MDLVGMLVQSFNIGEPMRRHFPMDPFELFDPHGNVSNAMGTSYNLFTAGNYLESNVGFDFQIVPQNSLHRAVMAGDSSTVEAILRLAQLRERRDKAGYTALHYAAMLGRTQMVQLLLKAGCCINSFGMHQVTPLHLACYHNHKDVVTILLRDKTINVNAQSAFGYTSLHLAAELGHLKIIRWLINAKAEINLRTMMLEIPLHLALEYKQWDAAKRLLAKGADPNAMRHNGGYPLHVAILSGVSPKIAEQLITASGNIDASDYCQHTPLHVAAQFGRWEITKLLIDHGANPLARTNQGMTPLHLAAYSLMEENIPEVDYCAVARYLCEKRCGNDVNAVDGFCRTALHHAARYGTVQMVKCLLDEQAADVNAGAPSKTAGTPSSRTPLHHAVNKEEEMRDPFLDSLLRKPSAEMVKLLIDHGANVNARDEQHLIPLHLAAEYCDEEVLKLLLGAGSCYDAPADTPTHQTPRERAEYNGINDDIIDQVAHFFEMVERNEVADARTYLILDPWMVGCRSANHQTPLHICARNGLFEMTELLLEFGANVEGKNGYNEGTSEEWLWRRGGAS